MRQRDKKSYPQFEGRILEFTYSRYYGGEKQYLRVIGCDYDIGITMVLCKDKNVEVCCMNGPTSPQGKMTYAEYPERLERYNKEFEFVINVLRNNTLFNADALFEYSGRSFITNGGMQSCSFR